MGEVYRGRDTRLSRTVAIKVLPAGMGEAERRERFEREARAISLLNHRHICVLFDVGQDRGISYLVMEYLEGETLAARIAKGPLSPESFIAYAVQMCQALAHAHEQEFPEPWRLMLRRTPCSSAGYRSLASRVREDWPELEVQTSRVSPPRYGPSPPRKDARHRSSSGGSR